MYNHNKAQQSKNRVHISWDILYVEHHQLDNTERTTSLSNLRCAMTGLNVVMTA